MGDSLSALSVLIATLSFFYDAWYPKIEDATNVRPERHHADRAPQVSIVASALLSKALPLLVISFLLLLICAPESLEIAKNWMRQSGWSFEVGQGAFLFIVSVLTLICLHIAYNVIKLLVICFRLKFLR
jgi:hypothetical protein